MSATNDGGPAGVMYLRDWFAGQALNGLLSKLPVVDQNGEFGIVVSDKFAYNDMIADSAYSIADAMLKARAK